MSEKKVKAKRKELLEIRKHLNTALSEILKAQAIAGKMASCCEVSLADLATNLENNIEFTNSHITKGFCKTDLIKVIRVKP